MLDKLHVGSIPIDLVDPIQYQMHIALPWRKGRQKRGREAGKNGGKEGRKGGRN